MNNLLKCQVNQFVHMLHFLNVVMDRRFANDLPECHFPSWDSKQVLRVYQSSFCWFSHIYYVM